MPPPAKHHHNTSSSSSSRHITSALPLPRVLERLLPRTGSLSWQSLLVAAAVGANVWALAYLARRYYASWLEQQQQEGKGEEDQQQEVARAALAYLQRLWDVAMQVGVRQSRTCGSKYADG